MVCTHMEKTEPRPFLGLEGDTPISFTDFGFTLIVHDPDLGPCEVDQGAPPSQQVLKPIR